MKNFIHKTSGIIVSLVFVSLVFQSCKTKPEDKPAQITPAESLKATRAMVDWLECEECVEGQLENVVKNGKLLRPLLLSTLKSGAAPASRELYRRDLEKRYDELMVYSETHPNSKPTLPKEEFVQLYLGKFDALYRVRSAQALAKIGGDGVREALQNAANTSAKADVKEAIAKSLGEMR